MPLTINQNLMAQNAARNLTQESNKVDLVVEFTEDDRQSAIKFSPKLGGSHACPSQHSAQDVLQVIQR
jgi:hypothetical protein